MPDAPVSALPRAPVCSHPFNPDRPASTSSAFGIVTTVTAAMARPASSRNISSSSGPAPAGRESRIPPPRQTARPKRRLAEAPASVYIELSHHEPTREHACPTIT